MIGRRSLLLGTANIYRPLLRNLCPHVSKRIGVLRSAVAADIVPTHSTGRRARSASPRHCPLIAVVGRARKNLILAVAAFGKDQ
jgi:hypothetical protein